MTLTDGLVDIEVHRIDELVINKDAREWCKLPYPGHENGCPEYGEKEWCPDNVPEIEEFIDLKREKWLVVARFDIDRFEGRTEERHRDKSRYKRCDLWKESVESKIEKFIERFVSGETDLVSTLAPEAMGVQVFATARKLGIPIKKEPEDYVYRIALVGHASESSES